MKILIKINNLNYEEYSYDVDATLFSNKTYNINCVLYNSKYKIIFEFDLYYKNMADMYSNKYYNY
jgi:hypothetical protein